MSSGTDGESPRIRRLGRLATLCVHAGAEASSSGPLDEPLVLSSTFRFEDADEAAHLIASDPSGPNIYSRWGNPTVASFEAAVAALEGAEAAVAFASGMAAISGVLETLLEPGAHVVVPSAVYAETSRILRQRLARYGVRATVVDMTDLAVVERAITPETRVVLVETPANPTLAITDIAAVAQIAHRAGALLVVDSTFATPFHQQPLALGADLVLHSATKALSGHGDVLGGVVCGRRVDLDRIRDESVRGAGAALAPFSAWLAHRGLRTLAVRQARASANAQEIAERLASHGAVARVRYPGLPAHPGHAIARAQMTNGFGSLIAFDAAAGFAGARALYDRITWFARAVSLGDVRSLITHAASTTHASASPADRQAAGIGDGTLRLSVGIEDVDDLWSALEQSLAPR